MMFALNVDLQKTAPVERTHRRDRQIPVMHAVRLDPPARPEQRLCAAIRPLEIGTCRERKRIAGVDVVHAQDIRVAPRDKLRERAHSTGDVHATSIDRGYRKR